MPYLSEYHGKLVPGEASNRNTARGQKYHWGGSMYRWGRPRQDRSTPLRYQLARAICDFSR
jgi:hypothetical protein